MQRDLGRVTVVRHGKLVWDDGASVYGTEDGEEYIVTMATRTTAPVDHNLNDIICLGEVGEWKREARPGDDKLIGKKGKGAL